MLSGRWCEVWGAGGMVVVVKNWRDNVALGKVR